MLFDPEVTRVIVYGTPEWVGLLLLLVSFVGSLYLTLPLCLVFAYRASSREIALWWGGLLSIGYVLVTGLKYLIGRPRPGLTPPFLTENLHVGFRMLADLAIEPTTPAFPSGHAFTATVFCGALFAELDIGTRRSRAGVAAILVLLVGISRVVHGVHYPGDVAAGMILGGFYLEGMIRLKRRLSTV